MFNTSLAVFCDCSGKCNSHEPSGDEVNEQHALDLWNAGEQPSFSTGICESLTCGYGTLDDSGYWEFPLYPAEQYLGKQNGTK